MAASLSPDCWVVEDQSQQKLQARYIAAALQSAGMRVHLADLNTSADTLVGDAARVQPRLIVFSILFAHRLDEHLRLMTQLRAAGIRAHLTMAGHLPALAYAELLNLCPALDSVVCGEMETTVTQLARSLGEPDRWRAVPGLAYRNPETRLVSHLVTLSGAKGLAFDREILRSAQNDTGMASEPCLNPPLKPNLNLHVLAPPLRDEPVPSFRGYGFATIEASRGCYHACTFCLPSAYYRRRGLRYRLRSVSNLIAEIETLYQWGVRLFLFDDEQFLPPGPARAQRVRSLGDELERRDLRIAFTIKCRADDVDVALFERLAQMGLVRVYVGIESGCLATLDYFGKRVSVEQNEQALAVLDELGIVADFRCLLFHPQTTLETVKTEVAFLRRILPHLATAFDFREVEVYPGTAMADRLGEGTTSRLPISYTLADPRAEILRRLCRLVFGSVYARFQEQLTEAWYDLVLAHRFQPSPADAERAVELKRVAASLNNEALCIWQDMLEFAECGDVHDADAVAERASEWVGRIQRQ